MKSALRGLAAAVAVAVVLSLSVAPAAAEYPPSDPPATPASSIPTQVAGTSTTNTGTGSGSLAFTGATIGGIAGLGTILVAAGGIFWLVGQRRRPSAADVAS